MDIPHHYQIILVIILLFTILWLLFGGKEYNFIGLKPLLLDKLDTMDDEMSMTMEEEKIIEVDPNNICVDITPELPIEFNKNVCVPDDNQKFLSKGEKICKETMEKIYGVPFKNTRPNWLKNEITNRNLELDCYNEQLKLAVEYNGEQHYKWPNYFKNQNYDNFKDQLKRDLLKKELCEKNDVHLIIVPYNVPYSMIPTFIVYHLPEIIQKRLKEDKFFKHN